MASTKLPFLIVAIFVCATLCQDNSHKRHRDMFTKQNFFGKLLVKYGYNMDKLEFILGMIKDIKTQMGYENKTVVAWQNIYHEDGSLKEILTLELTLPFKPAIVIENDEAAGRRSEMEDFDAEKSPIQTQKYMVKQITHVGLAAEASKLSFDKNGTLVAEIFMDESKIYVMEKGRAHYTVIKKTEDKNEVSNLLASLKKERLPPMVLKFDINDTFLESESDIKPLYLATIIEGENAPKEIMEGVLKGIIIAGLTDPENVCERLGSYMRKHFSGYLWHVTTVTDGAYLNHDFMIKVAYSPSKFEFGLKIYQVYGIKLL